ncbi:MAG: formylglycine-generating enzyme family protein [Burkholderiaceae bacterium]|nr:formylglycine-generating enzyme family protein [Burkholderiaceae bacterium]
MRCISLTLLTRPLMAVLASATLCSAYAQSNPAQIDWQLLDGTSMARTETTVGQFGRFVQSTGLITQAERQGGGEVYEVGWVRKAGWTWRTPYGPQAPAVADEPAVHVTYDEAQAFCQWAGGRLPSDAQWVRAAYTEQRDNPPTPLQTGRTYPYPTGAEPTGAQCLNDCGTAAAQRAVRHGARLSRGAGHALVTSTPAGINGLKDMGGNAWEWVDEPPGGKGSDSRLTRGGSWWYGAAQMRADHLQSKPGNTAVTYIGFRCVKTP